MFWIIGGDDRSFYTAQALLEAGCSIGTFGVPHMQDTEPNLPLDRVVLPFPSFSGGAIRAQAPIPLATLLPFLHKTSRIYGGLLGAQKEALSAIGAEVIDLYDAEPLTTENAVPTVEGALALAISHSPMTLHGSACLVIGAGRIGFLLAQALQKLGAHVTLSSRKTGQQAMTEALGMRSDETGVYRHGLSCYDFLFNTVPAQVLTTAQLAELPKNCLLTELASHSGFSMEECKQLGLQALSAGGLPGKYAPKTAGLSYAKQILEREASL